MANSLNDKIAIVTGAGRGIGRGVALFLASSASAYVTGQTIVADGGDTIA